MRTYDRKNGVPSLRPHTVLNIRLHIAIVIVVRVGTISIAVGVAQLRVGKLLQYITVVAPWSWGVESAVSIADRPGPAANFVGIDERPGRGVIGFVALSRHAFEVVEDYNGVGVWM